MVPGKTTNILRCNLDLYFITYVQYSVNTENTHYIYITTDDNDIHLLYMLTGSESVEN
jgi:hypothetical protein